MAMSWLAIL